MPSNVQSIALIVLLGLPGRSTLQRSKVERSAAQNFVTVYTYAQIRNQRGAIGQIEPPRNF